jgi:predicted aspartyl protease
MLVGTVSASLHVESPAQAGLRFPSGVNRIAVPIDIFEYVPYVSVRLNSGGRDLPFVLDTGAGDMTGLDEDTARQAGFSLGQGFPMGGAGEESVMGYRVDGGRLSIAGLVLEARPLIVLPLHRLDPFWGKRKDGLIGATLISQAVTVIDYAESALTLHRPEKYSWPREGQTIPLHAETGHAFVNVKVHLYGMDNPVETIMMVDTGLRVTSFSGPFWRAHDLAGCSPSRLETVTGFGIGGTSRGIIGRIRALEIGDILIREPVTDFSTDTRGALAGSQFGGIIGADILHRFRVILDYGGGRLGLLENKSFDDPYEWDMSGLWFRSEGPDFRSFFIQHVAPGTPAERTGLIVGDQLVKVDGIDAGKYTLESLRRLLKRDGKTIELTILRNGRTLNKTLLLKRLV